MVGAEVEEAESARRMGDSGSTDGVAGGRASHPAAARRSTVSLRAKLGVRFDFSPAARASAIDHGQFYRLVGGEDVGGKKCCHLGYLVPLRVILDNW